MTIAEENKFYETDIQAYIPEKNKEFMLWLYNKLRNGYNPYLDLESIKHLIQKVKLWYEMKYPNRELEYNDGVINTEFEGINNISENMSFDQFRYRLNHDELETFDCKYRSNSGYCQPDWGNYDKNITDGNGWIDFIGFKVNAEYPNEMKVVKMMSATAVGGLISPYEVSRLTDFIPEIPSSYITIKDLIKILKGSEKVSSTDLEKIEFVNKTDLELRTKIINMIILSLIYSKDTNPEYGIKRAHKFAEEVNTKYSITITVPSLTELTSVASLASTKLEEIKIASLKRKVKKQLRSN